MSQAYGGRPRSNSGRHFGGSSSSSRRPRYRNTGVYIEPSRYVKTAQAPAQRVAYVAEHQFKDFGLHDLLLANLSAKGFVEPTPIQDQAIPALLQGKDVIGIANTGTGKTAAFLLPLLNKVLLDPTQGVLILAPTRELAVQIADEFKSFAGRAAVSHCLCIGGQNINAQVYQLRKDPHFVIGTPGRIKDLIQRGNFNTAMFTNVVLDEVDRMLDIGFLPDINFLIDQLPAQRQSAFFSATITRQTDMVARSFLTDPVMVEVKQEHSSNHIEQDVVKLQPGENKIDVLHRLLQDASFKKVIVFGTTKRGINKLEMLLSERGIRVTSIHGNKSQNARQHSLQVFKAGRVQALLATDVAARGIDVDDVTHVINFDQPQSFDDYTHRIGRTGRAGKMGKALTFI
jgi:ATP-dependent RNA helicase RhlE